MYDRGCVDHQYAAGGLQRPVSAAEREIRRKVRGIWIPYLGCRVKNPATVIVLMERYRADEKSSEPETGGADHSVDCKCGSARQADMDE